MNRTVACALLLALAAGCPATGGNGRAAGNGRIGGHVAPLRNGGLEIWGPAGKPVHWHIREGHNDMAGPSETERTEGRTSLKLEGEFTYMFLSQDIGGMGPLAGRLVEFAADVKCFEQDAASIYVIQPDFGELYSPKHPGDGEWHTLRITFRVPAFSVYDAFTVCLGLGNIPQKPSYFDNVRVRVLQDESDVPTEEGTR